jgi:hypothetical protein
MSNYTKSTNFATKDNLTPGDPLKVVRGTEIDTEFNNIATAVATKTDNSAAAITGGAIDGATVGATTPATGSFTTLAASGTTTLAGALVGAATQAAFNTVSTTLNLGGAATAVNLGAATGTATVNNTTLAAKAITASTTLAVTGTSTLTGAVTATAGVSGPITSSSVSITGGSITGITDLAVADGGTGASTAVGALNNLLPSQTGNSSKYLQTDGTNASWDAVSLSTADITGTLGAANGGTGVSNNALMTVTGSGNFAYTRTLTGTTNVTFPTTGTLATLAGTETLTNKTLTSPTLTTPTLGVATGTSFQGIIGNVTPAAGSFTTLGASSTATLNTLASSGATLTGGTINGMTIGATTATTGAFTTLTTSSTVTHNGGTANGVTYLNGSKVLTSGSALVFDGTSFGVGTATPQNYSASANNIVVAGTGQRGITIASTDSTQSNLFFADADSGTGEYAGYLAYFHSSDSLAFAANATEQMRLTSTGLGIGTSSPAEKLDVRSSSNAIGNFQSSNASGYAGINAINGSRSWYAGIRADASNGFGIRDETAGATRLLIDSSGNLGLGVTPSAWASGYNAIQFGSGSSRAGALFTNGINDLWQLSNAYFNGSNFIYYATGVATAYNQSNGSHNWRYAASGTAGNAISFTQAMTLDASGQLAIGGTSAIARLDVQGGWIRTANGTSTSYLGDGVSLVSGASASSSAVRFDGDSLLFSNSATERARITSGGDFGLGTTSPNAKLAIGVAAAAVDGTKGVRITNSGGGIVMLENGSSNDSYVGTLSASDFCFRTNNTERARIDTSGNFLVHASGTDPYATSSGYGIALNGSADYFAVARSGGAAIYAARQGSNGTLAEWWCQGNNVGSISVTTTATAYNTSSDYRLKNTIAPMTGALAKVALLKPVTYKWNLDGSNCEGFIAHELAEVVPYAVTGEKDAVDADGKPQYQGIDVSFLVATLTAAIQELKAEFDAYKASHP